MPLTNRLCRLQHFCANMVMEPFGIEGCFYDGGYHTWPQLIDPYKYQLDDSAEVIWSDHQ